MKQQASRNFRQHLQLELSERTRRNPLFSLRSFSRQLGISSSYLSKILKGERSVNERLIRSAGVKLKVPEAAVAEMLGAHRVEKELDSKHILVDIPRGSAYRLLGLVPEKAANAYLEKRGLVAVPAAQGQALGGLAIQTYEGTNFGRYEEFYFTLFVREKSSSTVGFAFDTTLVSSPEVKDMYLKKLGVPQRMGAIKVEISKEAPVPRKIDLSVTASEGPEDPGGTPYWEASIGTEAGFIPGIEKNSAVAFSMGDERLMAYRIDLLPSVLYKRPFLPASDRCRIHETSRLGRLIHELGGFTPIEWHYGHEFAATIYKPMRRK